MELKVTHYNVKRGVGYGATSGSGSGGFADTSGGSHDDGCTPCPVGPPGPPGIPGDEGDALPPPAGKKAE